MKYAAILISLLFVCFTSSCASRLPELNSGEKMAAKITKSSEVNRGANNRRERNKNLMDSLTDSTYHVVRDCTPKKDVVVLGSSNPKISLDGRGTGVVVRSYEDRSYVVTAAHVVDIDKDYEKGYDCEYTVQPTKYVGTKRNIYKATVLVSHAARDLAVLKVGEDLGLDSPIELEPFTGEDIWAVGFPYQFANPSQEVLSITKGTLATLNVDGGSAGKYHRVTSQVYHGNSGGGVWNKTGSLIGIVVSFYGQSSGPGRTIPYEGYYYIKPIDELLMILKHEGVYWEVFSL